MENILKSLTSIEEKITLSIDLLEIAKNYSEHNFDKGQEVIALGSLLEVVLEVQKHVADSLDGLI